MFAQNSKPIQADRPNQTETAAIVTAGVFQIENGFTFQKNDANCKTYRFPSILWKYGVNKQF